MQYSWAIRKYSKITVERSKINCLRAVNLLFDVRSDFKDYLERGSSVLEYSLEAGL